MFGFFRLPRRIILFFVLFILASSPLSISADVLSQSGLVKDDQANIIDQAPPIEDSYQEGLHKLAGQFYDILNREETKELFRQFLNLLIGIMEMMKSWLS